MLSAVAQDSQIWSPLLCPTTHHNCFYSDLASPYWESPDVGVPGLQMARTETSVFDLNLLDMLAPS